MTQSRELGENEMTPQQLIRKNPKYVNTASIEDEVKRVSTSDGRSVKISSLAHRVKLNNCISSFFYIF